MANISIIAPLTAAGDFPVTTADQINLNPEKPEEGTVQDAISALQRQVGLDTDSEGSESSTAISLPNKIDNLAEDLTEKLAGITGQITSSETQIETAIGGSEAQIKTAIKGSEEVILAILRQVSLSLDPETTTSLPVKIDELSNNLLQNFDDKIDDLANNTITDQTNALTELCNDIVSSISSLRSHINTISPPTLTASHNGKSVYAINETPSLTITAEVNRPLETPLDLRILNKSVSYYELKDITPYERSYTDGVTGTGQSMNLWPDDSFTAFVIKLPSGINKVSIAGTQLYHTTGYGNLSYIAAPVRGSVPTGYEYVCKDTDIIYDTSQLTASDNENPIYSGCLTLSWPSTVEANYVRVNCFSSSEIHAFVEGTRSYTETWTPVYTEGASLPYRQYAKVQIVHEDDPTQIFAEESLSCVFGANIYWWTGTDSFIETNSKLTAGHPGNTTFTCTGAQYCYYAAPADYETPTFTVSGASGGFSRYKTEDRNGILYNIYKSNNQLNSITVNIK